MSSILLKNAGGFERWRRAVSERASQLLTDDLIETEDDSAPDPFSNKRPNILKDDATTQDIALWEARERQYVVVHGRVQQLLDFMTQTIEPSLYDRVLVSNDLKKRTPTLLYRAIKKTLAPSSKSTETDLRAKMENLERTAKTTDVDIWLNNWIQVESLAKASNYSWSIEVIDHFHAALGKRSVFFATSFASHIWMGSITLSQLAEQYRLCEAKLKRFENITSHEVENVFLPPVSLASDKKDTNKPSKKEREKGKFPACPCGYPSHSIKKCHFFNKNTRPKNWTDRRSFKAKKDMFDMLMNTDSRSKIEQELGHEVPRDMLKEPVEKSSSMAVRSEMESLHDEYVAESSIPDHNTTYSSYILALATSQASLPYKNWWVFDSGSGRHICHKKDLFWSLKPIKSHEVITTGAGDCKVEGVGTVMLRVKTPTGLGTMKIQGVLYVPDFMANIVSMDRIKDQMLIWDHTENWLTRWDSSRTPVIKIWNQYNQNFIAKEAVYPEEVRIVSDIPETISQDLILNNCNFATKTSAVKKVSSADVIIWHRRLGHPGPNTISKLSNAIIGANVTGSYDGTCEDCLLAKSKRIVSRIPVDRGDSLWSRMHVDLIIFSKAWNGENYALHAYDAKGCGHLIETLSSKDQLTLRHSIASMIRRLRNEGRVVKYLHSDNEKGFGTDFKKMLKSEGIIFETTVPYSPEQNGFAEASGNRICVVARALRINSGFPEKLWPELVGTAVYLLNRTPNKKLGWQTPYEQYNSRKPDISNLKVVGCRAYVHIPRQIRLASEKLSERAWIGYLIGYEAHNIWRIWHPTSNQVIRVRDVVFLEDRLYRDDTHNKESPIEIDQLSITNVLDADNFLEPRLNRWNTIENDKNSSNNSPIRVLKSENFENTNVKMGDTLKSEGVPEYHNIQALEDVGKNVPGYFSSPTPVKTNLAPRENEITANLDVKNIISGPRNRTRKPDTSAAIYMEPDVENDHLSGQPFFSCLVSSITTDRFSDKINRFDNDDIKEGNPRDSKSDPDSWKQMIKHPERNRFILAAQEEFQGLHSRGAWEVIDITSVPEGSQIFPMRWVFVSKRDGDGNVVKFKARIVVRGDLDKTPYNRDEIYSHTLSLQHFRSIMAYINYTNMETLSFDAVQAFVNARRDKPIYCYLPEGFRQRGKVLLVWQALYGHRKSPKDWFDCYTNALKSLNFRPVSEEKCFWIHDSGIILFFYVDDSIMAFHKKDEGKALELQENLCQLFPIKKLGEAKSFLGLSIYRDRQRRKLWLVQKSYINRIKKSYNIKPSVKLSSPLAPDYDMSPNTGSKLSADLIQLYQRKVGSAVYAAICTRPDISLAVSLCADHLLNPAMRHLHAITHILQYLVNTKSYGILYDCELLMPQGRHSNCLLMASDASFGDNEGRKSSQGFVAFLYGGPIVWHASKQRSVTTSTTEAELVALSAAARELLALERFLSHVSKGKDLSMTLMCDNKQTVELLTRKTPLLTTKLRHIDIHQHWLRERLQRSETDGDDLNLIWTPTSDMPADGLTKRLHISRHQNFVKLIGLDDTTYLDQSC